MSRARCVDGDDSAGHVDGEMVGWPPRSRQQVLVEGGGGDNSVLINPMLCMQK